jgi:lysophospholipase L1-like esterase
MRIHRVPAACALAILIVTLTAAACSNNNSPIAPTPPTPGSTVVYSPVGASDVTGEGSSKVCLPFLDCDGNGYVYVAARQMKSQGFLVDTYPLGIPGAVISRGFQDLAAQYGRTDVMFNLTQSTAPFVRRDATLVTVFTGANDINVLTSALGGGAGGNNPSGFIDQEVAAFGADYTTLLTTIRGLAPKARIVVFNLPNLGGLPYLATASLAQRQAAQRASVGMTAQINRLAGVAVVDLMCDARFYQPGTFSSDGFHPNDQGYAMMAAEVVAAYTSASYPAPQGSCPQMTLF